jgi:peptidoglycan/xylan/chitin deacetylase (PgdA/CDA1 family)
MYHRVIGSDEPFVGVPVSQFLAQMSWLREHCEPIGPAALIERSKQGRTKRPAALVTFDDGYRDYHDLAYPILKSLGIPALVFLTTSLMDEGGMLWTDELQWAVLASKAQRVSCPWDGGTVVSILDESSRRSWGQIARRHLKGLADGERQEALARMLSELGRPPALERQMLSWDEVRATCDLTVFGGHTHTHPNLSRVDRSRAESEIRTCRERILSETGSAPSYFAYPNGQPQDFTAETQTILRENGFTLAFSTIEGIAGADGDWMAVKRLPGNASTIAQFAWTAAGLKRET